VQQPRREPGAGSQTAPTEQRQARHAAAVAALLSRQSGSSTVAGGGTSPGSRSIRGSPTSRAGTCFSPPIASSPTRATQLGSVSWTPTTSKHARAESSSVLSASPDARPVESSHDRANTHVHASGATQRRDHREQTACSERRGFAPASAVTTARPQEEPSPPPLASRPPRNDLRRLRCATLASALSPLRPPIPDFCFRRDPAVRRGWRRQARSWPPGPARASRVQRRLAFSAHGQQACRTSRSLCDRRRAADRSSAGWAYPGRQLAP
jgi:hypothetical protein